MNIPRKIKFNPLSTPLATLLFIMLMANINICISQTVTSKIIINGVVYRESHGNSNAVKGSGNIITENRQISDFQRVANHISADINYQSGPTPSLAISGDDNILPLITTTVNSGQLTLSTSASFSTHSPIVITIDSPHLTAFSSSGSGDAALQGINEPEFAVELNGSGNLIADGRTGHLQAKASGSSDIDVKNLMSRIADVSISGSGNVKVTADEALNATITGSGDISYYGQPKFIDKQILGSGKMVAGD